ncbi:hypothetical protein [Chroococcidiopsis sp. CCMEE 29]|uniref:hypothetical protein n=1 Tax=Chroococcidiopsis sp. CCMEE 29 TaxID=155894 RepID=UPI002020E8E8|nr:hypothetical protein [Chroococcidiopsis sp. CCMEE 29]
MSPVERLLYLILQRDGEDALTEVIFWATNESPHCPESLRLQQAMLKVLNRTND